MCHSSFAASSVIGSHNSHHSTDMEDSKALILPNVDDIYKYYLHDILSSSFQKNAHTLSPGTKCRFLTSKGKNSKKTQLAKDTVVLPQTEADEDSDRITIQYPKGSTYQLRKAFLFPILTGGYHIVVADETDFYRRMCWVHTEDHDAFIEIGCDMGFTVGEMTNVPCRLGIDKSEVSLEQLRGKYCTCPTLQMDLLEEDASTIQNVLTQNKMDVKSWERNGGKLVVAIDINGNREIEGVVECVNRVLTYWRPTLVIVKSRSLYSYIKSKNEIYEETPIL